MREVVALKSFIELKQIMDSEVTLRVLTDSYIELMKLFGGNIERVICLKSMINSEG